MKVNKDHNVFKPCYNIMEQLRELTTIAEAERDVSGYRTYIHTYIPYIYLVIWNHVAHIYTNIH